LAPGAVVTTIRLLLDLSGMGVELDLSDETLASDLRSIWRGFESTAQQTPSLALDVEIDGGPGLDRGSGASREVRIRRVEHGVTFELDEGRAHLDGASRGRLRVMPDDSGTQAWRVHNLLLPTFAWTLATARQGALLHGAAIVVGGCSHVLIGREGSGKSTFARLAAGAGVTVLGEDLTFVDGSGGRLEVIGTPYRVENATRTGPGRWPLGALLLPAHGDDPRLDEVARIEAVATVAANLPFLAGDDASIEVAERVVSGCAVRRLTFARDERFVSLLRAAGLGHVCGDDPPRR
jgi:hypothetical protein